MNGKLKGRYPMISTSNAPKLAFLFQLLLEHAFLLSGIISQSPPASKPVIGMVFTISSFGMSCFEVLLV